MRLGTYSEGATKVEIDGLVLDEEAKEVVLEGEPVRLTPIEYKITELLMKMQGVCFRFVKFMNVFGMRKLIMLKIL